MKPTQHQKGFTLVEVLVAVSILLFVVTGPMTIAVQSNRSTSFAIEQSIAFLLAQEGLELAQNARDNYQIPELETAGTLPNPWDEFKADYDDCFDSSGCALEIDTTITSGVVSHPGQPKVEVEDCLDPDECRLYIDDFSGQEPRARYTHVDNSPGDEETPYTRTIRMEAIDDSVKVTATVSWRPSNQITEQEVEVVTYLFDIYGN